METSKFLAFISYFTSKLFFLTEVKQWHTLLVECYHRRKLKTKPNQTKPNQTKPNQTKPNQTKLMLNNFSIYAKRVCLPRGLRRTLLSRPCPTVKKCILFNWFSLLFLYTKVIDFQYQKDVCMKSFNSCFAVLPGRKCLRKVVKEDRRWRCHLNILHFLW